MKILYIVEQCFSYQKLTIKPCCITLGYVTPKTLQAMLYLFLYGGHLCYIVRKEETDLFEPQHL